MSVKRPWFTIERLRTLVLVGGIVLVAAIGIFLGAAQWKLRRVLKDIPGKLGIDIQQQADGVNYTQSRKGKTLFKIHAARAVQMKKDGKTLLHDVRIELYGQDGKSMDTISGSEFEYDPGAGVAQAAGAVEITLTRPGEAPAIAELKPGAAKMPAIPSQLASQVTDNEIHVKTSGLTFDQKSGVATTQQRVDFALRQGNGSSTGATYSSTGGHLVLDRAVELHVNRIGGPVTVHAGHAEFERTQQLCQLTQAQAEYAGGSAQTGNALIHFRDDGSVLRLDGSGGVDLHTATGGHVTAPRGTLDFDEDNHPHRGLLEGGAKLDMAQPNRQMQGSAPTARLDFDGEGQLRHARLEQGVYFHLQQPVASARDAAGEMTRTWKSQNADIVFAPAAAKKAGQDQKQARGQSSALAGSRTEPRTIHGDGGVVITSQVAGAGGAGPSQLSADAVVAELAPGGELSTLSSSGHAHFDQTTAAGVHQTSNSDQLDVRFRPGTGTGGPKKAAKGRDSAAENATEIASIVEVGHVVLVQDSPANRARNMAASEVRATSARSDYDGSTQLLHLTGSPRIQNGALEMSANAIDFARESGDALAHGDVKASWTGTSSGAGSVGGQLPGATMLGSGGGNGAGNGPIHAIAAEAEMHQAAQQVVFRGQGSSAARLWQAGNSVSAPRIVLNRQMQTLTAQGNGATSPVRTVLVSTGAGMSRTKDKAKDKPGTSVLRMTSGELRYSEGERMAWFRGGSVGSVTAENSGSGGASTVVSDAAEVRFLPAGVRGGAGSSPGAAAGIPAGNASVDRITAQGHVSVNWPGRKGMGDKLVYLSDDGTFTLTGTSSAPPRITDPVRGNVTGSALVYHTRDDSVTVEGDGGKTVTETHSLK